MRDADSQQPSDAATSAATMRSATIAVALSGGLIAVLAFATFDARTGLGALLGGALATANLWVMARVARAFVAQRGATSWAAIAAVKFVALFVGVWLLLRSNAIPALALIAGYAALPIGITLGSLFGPKPVDLPPDDLGEDTSLKDDSSRA
jgi:hypothetical protein